MKSLEEHIKLLDETAAFYNTGNRCIGELGACMYFVEGKPGCAIGRLIADKDLCRELDKLDLPAVATVYDQFPPELQEYKKEFLSDLQALHDGGYYWDEQGINGFGKRQVEVIKSNLSKYLNV